jgi:A/G-specific adenine glycosylase
MTLKAWTPSELRSLRKRATAWYDSFGRDLPWRRTRDPYAIWISEIMLQQTQVATVIPYYERFLKSFPTVGSLANAPLDQVLQHWAGLGYYRRARQLHSAAQRIEKECAGIFPTDWQTVHALPGIGRYTAGAILSFATDQRLPIVEANTQRLYARLLHLDDDLSMQSAQSALWQFAESVLPTRHGSGHVNQALMEIGSQICLPKEPACLICPLRPLCPTFKSGLQARIPRPKQKKSYTDLQEAVLLIHDREHRWLMRRSSERERWAGLWDFPRFDITHCESELLVRSNLKQQFENAYECAIEIGEVMHQLKHAVTRYRILLLSFRAHLYGTRKRSRFGKMETQWVSESQLDQIALCASAKKVWQWLKRQH